MTFDNDCIRIFFSSGKFIQMTCKEAGVEWPPPLTMDFSFDSPSGRVKGVLRQTSISQLSDEDRAKSPYVIRGAMYDLTPTRTN